MVFNSYQSRETWKLMLPPHDVFLITIAGLCENSCATTLLHLTFFFTISFILSHKDPFACHWFYTIRCTDYRSENSSLSKRSTSIVSFSFRSFIILCTLFNRWFMILILINCYITWISIHDIDLVSIPYRSRHDIAIWVFFILRYLNFFLVMFSISPRNL